MDKLIKNLEHAQPLMLAEQVCLPHNTAHHRCNLDCGHDLCNRHCKPNTICPGHYR